MIMINLSFQYGGEELTCKISISTLNSVCERDEWLKMNLKLCTSNCHISYLYWSSHSNLLFVRCAMWKASGCIWNLDCYPQDTSRVLRMFYIQFPLLLDGHSKTVAPYPLFLCGRAKVCHICLGDQMFLHLHLKIKKICYGIQIHASNAFWKTPS